MRMIRGITLGIVATCLSWCAGCSSAPKAAKVPTVTGTATYFQKMELPPTAIFEVKLVELSRPDAPGKVVNRYAVQHAGQVPLRFAIPFEAAQIDPSGRYALEAGIWVGDRCWFTNDIFYPVLTRGSPSQVNMRLRIVK